MAVTTAKEQLSILLGRYFKRGSIVYFVRGINIHTSKLLVEYSPTEYLVAKRLFIQRIDTYYNMDCLEFDIKDFFSSHNISDYILV